jgi:hypothetical protein
MIAGVPKTHPTAKFDARWQVSDADDGHETGESSFDV